MRDDEYNDDVVWSIAIPVWLSDKLERQARKRHMSMKRYLRMILERAARE